MVGQRSGRTISTPSGNRYRLDDFLGRGAFGEVYRAEAEKSGEIVAVKLLPVEDLDEISLTALLNEAKIATAVVHPNVVRVLDVGDSVSNSDEPFIVMEYVPGGTLARILKKQRTTQSLIHLSRAQSMMLDMAQGARAINEQVVHRDIKPDNILVEDGRLKIGDFGIAKLVAEQTRTHSFKGRQHIWYMAPEGWEGEANTPKLDVYAVGLVFYQILTLEHPLQEMVEDGGDWRNWRDAHLFRHCPDVRGSRDDVPSAMAQLLLRMVDKRPAKRPEWDDVISILTGTAEFINKQSAVDSAIEVAVRRAREIEEQRLAEELRANKEARQQALYEYSCQQVLSEFHEVTQEFNKGFQSGSIEPESGAVFQFPYAVSLNVPNGRRIHIRFFPLREVDIELKGGRLSGGGLIQVEGGAGANLVRLIEGPGDLYGRWIVCFVSINPIFNARSLVGKFGVSLESVFPMGFSEPQDFYDQMQHTHGMHVFKYDFQDDLNVLMVDMIREALRQMP